jgi:hypothetical protein
MGEQFKRFYPVATLEQTASAIQAEVINGRPKKVTGVEGIEHEKDDGTIENLNEASYEEFDSPRAILTMLNDFVIVDVSTPQGLSNAAAAGHGRTNIGGPAAQFDIWVEGQEERVPVQILGKHA